MSRRPTRSPFSFNASGGDEGVRNPRFRAGQEAVILEAVVWKEIDEHYRAKITQIHANFREVRFSGVFAWDSRAAATTEVPVNKGKVRFSVGPKNGFPQK